MVGCGGCTKILVNNVTNMTRLMAIIIDVPNNLIFFFSMIGLGKMLLILIQWLMIWNAVTSSCKGCNNVLCIVATIMHSLLACPKSAVSLDSHIFTYYSKVERWFVLRYSIWSSICTIIWGLIFRWTSYVSWLINAVVKIIII